MVFLSWVPEDRDLAHRQQLRDSPRAAPDLTATAPYVASLTGSPSAPHVGAAGVDSPIQTSPSLSLDDRCVFLLLSTPSMLCDLMH